MLQRAANILSLLENKYTCNRLKVVVNLRDENQKNGIIGMIANGSEMAFCGDAFKKYGVENIVYQKKNKPKAIYSLWIIDSLDDVDNEKIEALENMHIHFSRDSDLIISDNKYFCKKILKEKCVKEEYLINLEDALIN